MVYIRADGTVVDSKTIFRISIFSDIFWGFINFLWLFISTLIDPKKPLPKPPSRSFTIKSKGNGGGGGGGGGGGDNGKRPRGPNIHQLKPTNTNCSSGS
jgi:hypothetical protein